MSEIINNIGFLFDLDGVIIDSENQYTKIWARINDEFPTGIPNFEHKIKGSTLSKILNENYHSDEIRSKVESRLHQLENQMHYDYLPFAKEFLMKLKERNLPCVLVTSSDNEKMRHLWEELPKLKNFFDFIITSDLVTKSKPDPEGYILGASKINVLPKNCVVFEDSLQGVMAGKAADAIVVGVAGTLPKEKLAPYSHILVDNFENFDLDNLIRILKER